MKRLFAREDVTPYRRDYTAAVPTSKGERLMVELIRCEDCKSPQSSAALWYKHGYTKTRLASWWAVDTYATEPDGSCWGRYNPTHIPGENKLNFEWVLPATEENAAKILAEVARLAGIV